MGDIFGGTAVDGGHPERVPRRRLELAPDRLEDLADERGVGGLGTDARVERFGVSLELLQRVGTAGGGFAAGDAAEVVANPVAGDRRQPTAEAAARLLTLKVADAAGDRGEDVLYQVARVFGIDAGGTGFKGSERRPQTSR